MRKTSDSLPSKEESEKETKKRWSIIDKILPELKSFCEAVIIAGSTAYGKNFSVRKESDIDLIILINREDIDKILKSKLFTITPQVEEAKAFFKNKEVDHFSIIENIDGISPQYHFWDKEAHFKAELLQLPIPKVYNVFRLNQKQLSGLDFSGKERYLDLTDVKKCKYGIIHIYPSHFIQEGAFVPKEPILNLITAPDIAFVKDQQLLRNIDKIWENLTKRLVEESNGKIDLNKKSIIKSVYGHWNLNPDSRTKLEKRQKDELAKLGFKL
jgi:hypothetical protein